MTGIRWKFSATIFLTVRFSKFACSPSHACFPQLPPIQAALPCPRLLCLTAVTIQECFMAVAWKSPLDESHNCNAWGFFSAFHLKYDQAYEWATRNFSADIWNQSKTWLFHLISHVLFDVACFSNPVSLPSEAAPQRTQRFQYWSWRSTEGHLTNATLSPSRSSWKFFNVFLFFCERT